MNYLCVKFGDFFSRFGFYRADRHTELQTYKGA